MADTAATKSPKKKVPKPKEPAAHPKYSEMVNAWLQGLQLFSNQESLPQGLQLFSNQESLPQGLQLFLNQESLPQGLQLFLNQEIPTYPNCIWYETRTN